MLLLLLSGVLVSTMSSDYQGPLWNWGCDLKLYWNINASHSLLRVLAYWNLIYFCLYMLMIFSLKWKWENYLIGGDMVSTRLTYSLQASRKLFFPFHFRSDEKNVKNKPKRSFISLMVQHVYFFLNIHDVIKTMLKFKDV